jgi:hypothetical protein
MENQPVTKYDTMEEAQEALTRLQAENPGKTVHALRVTGRLIEAGVEVTLSGPGCHAVITLNPEVEADVSYALLEHIPAAAEAALESLYDRMMQADG